LRKIYLSTGNKYGCTMDQELADTAAYALDRYCV